MAVAAAVLVGVPRGVRARCGEGAEAGKGEGVGERDRGGAWRRPDASGKRQAGREELASSAARVRARSCSYWQEEDDREGGGGGLGQLAGLPAGPARWATQ